MSKDKIKVISLGEVEVKVYTLKYGKFKKVIKKFADLVTLFMQIVDDKEKDIVKELPDFVKNNINRVEELLCELTDLTPERLEEVYITDFGQIFKEILAMHDLSPEDLFNFFGQIQPLMGQEEEQDLVKSST